MHWWQAEARLAFLFHDSLTVGGYIFTGGYEGEIRDAWKVQQLRAKVAKWHTFAGIVCVETPFCVR